MKLSNTVVRRVVTGHNAAGKSIVLVDDTTEPVETSTVNSTRMWTTNSHPPKSHSVEDAMGFADRMEPLGSNFLLLFVPPDDPDASMEEMERQWAARFDAIGEGHIRVDTSKHPRMHKTRTIDYLVVLSGEVTLLLDEEEVVLKPFDTIVQQATNHGWVNRTSEPAVLAVIMTGQDLA